MRCLPGRAVGMTSLLPVAQGPTRRLERADEDAHVVRPSHDRPGGHRVVTVPRVDHFPVEHGAPGTLPVHLNAVATWELVHQQFENVITHA